MFLGLGKRGGLLTGTRLVRKLVGSLVDGSPLYARLDVTRSEPTEALLARVDHLHKLGTFHICLGGEPFAHPDIHEVIGHAARRAQISVSVNGFSLWLRAPWRSRIVAALRG